MMKALTIKTLKEQEIDTRFGKKKKWLVSFQEKDNFLADSWRGNWNSNWAVGKQIQVHDSQWKKREYQGKIYWSITAPPQPTIADIDELKQEIQTLKDNFSSLNDFVQALMDKPEEEPPEEPPEEMPPEDMVRTEDIPF